MPTSARSTPALEPIWVLLDLELTRVQPLNNRSGTSFQARHAQLLRSTMVGGRWFCATEGDRIDEAAIFARLESSVSQ